MRLYEYQGKALFKKAKIPIPKSTLITKSQQKLAKGNYLLKAQLLQGKRGKAGLIKHTTKASYEKDIRSLLNKTHNKEKVKAVLAEQILDIKEEHYLSVRVDRTNNQYAFLYSNKGGINIEQQRATKQTTNPNKLPKKIQPFAKKLLTLAKQNDLILAEINPLVKTKNNKFIAADAKCIVDDNALFRHPTFLKEKESRKTTTQKQADKINVHYVQLEGDIGVIGNGAGLVMTTLDLLKRAKLKPKNFLDLKGGANERTMRGALQLILKQKPKAVFINVFGGITQCDKIAKGLAQYKKQHKIRIPIITRMIGTNEKEAKQILKQAKITPVNSIEEGIKEVKKRVKA